MSVCNHGESRGCQECVLKRQKYMGIHPEEEKGLRNYNKPKKKSKKLFS